MSLFKQTCFERLGVSSVTQRLNEISIAQAHRICRWHSLTFLYFFFVYLFAWLPNIWEISLLRQVFCTLCLLHYSIFFQILLNHAILILMRGYRCQPMALWNLNYRYIILTCGISYYKICVLCCNKKCKVWCLTCYIITQKNCMVNGWTSTVIK